MNQKGFIAVYLVLALLVVGSLGTIAFKLDSRGFERGKAEVEAQVAKRDNAALQDALNRLKQAQDRVRAAEDRNKVDLAKVVETYKKDLTNVKSVKDRTIADLNSGNLRLRVNLASCTSNSDGDPNSKVGTSGQQHNGGTATGFLGEADATFLIEEASRADKIVKQLTAAQEILKKDREVK